MTVEEILDQLDEMIDKAWSLPLSGGKCVVAAEQLRDCVDGIRANLPIEVRQAKAIVTDRADIIATARKEAEGIVRTAEERARRLVQQEEVVRQAQEKATEMLNQAQQKSREMRRSAYDFSEDMLKRTEETLALRLNEVRQVRQTLRNPPAPMQDEQGTNN